jgi:hypothetical protein
MFGADWGMGKSTAAAAALPTATAITAPTAVTAGPPSACHGSLSKCRVRFIY